MEEVGLVAGHKALVAFGGRWQR